MRALEKTRGFTLLELLIVISIIGILVTVAVYGQRDMQDFASDSERADDVASIARRLEQAYTNQEIGGPSYPSTAELAADIPNQTRTLKGINIDALQAPGESTPSVIAATSTSTTTPVASVTPSTYVYQPFKSDGTLCTANPSTASASENCVRFFLYYRTAVGSQLRSLASLHQQ